MHLRVTTHVEVPMIPREDPDPQAGPAGFGETLEAPGILSRPLAPLPVEGTALQGEATRSKATAFSTITPCIVSGVSQAGWRMLTVVAFVAWGSPRRGINPPRRWLWKGDSGARQTQPHLPHRTCAQQEANVLKPLALRCCQRPGRLMLSLIVSSGLCRGVAAAGRGDLQMSFAPPCGSCALAEGEGSSGPGLSSRCSDLPGTGFLSRGSDDACRGVEVETGEQSPAGGKCGGRASSPMNKEGVGRRLIKSSSSSKT